MADEPNKRIDEVLKAYADKRRQEAGGAMELHPATRQMLHGEVARTYKPVPSASWLQRVLVFWPRIAFAAACLAITLTLMLIVLPRQTVMEMAQTTPASGGYGRDARTSDKEEAELLDSYADAPAPAASTAPAMPGKPLDQFAKNEADEFKSKSELAVEARKDTDAVKLMREENVIKETARQSFANNVDSSRARYTQQKQDVQLGAKLANVQAVLNNFELEQRGNEIRITDEDGSIYVGNVLSQDDAKKRSYRPQNVPRQAPVGGVAGPAESQTLFFAFGTNVSLKQEVSIEANILQVTNVIAPPALAPATRAVNEPQNRRGAGAVMQQTIQGRAKVGTNQEVFINAVPSQQ